jgi:hypothetical protein
MIRLDLKREPYWLDLVPGERVHVRPCTTALIMAARAAVARGADGAPGDVAVGERAKSLVAARPGTRLMTGC